MLRHDPAPVPVRGLDDRLRDAPVRPLGRLPFATAVLLLQGSVLVAALLFGSSIAVMLIGDNVVQPAPIGYAIRLQFLLALVGTFEGLDSFGLVGVFLGPVIMAILLLVWHKAMDGTGAGQLASAST